VTRLDIALHPVRHVTAGTALYPLDRAPELLGALRDHAEEQPDELTVHVAINRAENHVALKAVFAGRDHDAQLALAPYRDAAGPAIADDIGRMPVADLQLGGTRPQHFELLPDLDDFTQLAILETAAHADAVEIRHWGGAMAEPGGPVGHRHVPFSITIDGPPAARDAIAPHATGGTFLNFCHDETRAHDAYTPADLARLQDLKAAYDPANVFGVGRGIAARDRAWRRAG
jgi:hypothetical protein